MDAVTVTAWGAIIVPIVLAILGIVNIWMTRTVHAIVNSAMTQEKTENAILKGLLVSKQLEIDTAERARLALATATSDTLRANQVLVETVKFVEKKEPVPPILNP